MEKYLTFKQLVVLLSTVRCKEDLRNFCFQVDMSYLHDKISYKDNDTLYYIVNNVVKREFIDEGGVYEIHKIRTGKGIRTFN